MAKSDSNKRKGFSIIEVSLVLAIAGLIFLMVFIALPSLQRTQRDAERREDIDTLLSAVKKYQTNNRGALPTEWDTSFKDNYLNDFEDPTGNPYNLVVCDYAKGGCNNLPTDDTAFPNNFTVYIVKQAVCSNDDSDSLVTQTNNPRRIAVLYALENPGTYCNNT